VASANGHVGPVKLAVPVVAVTQLLDLPGQQFRLGKLQQPDGKKSASGDGSAFVEESYCGGVFRR
jgi:hypothetical protein